jgi:hypothetical protein
MKRGFIIAFTVAALAGCTRVSEFGAHEDSVVFKAFSADAPVTKTVLQEDGSVLWCPQEDINVFHGSNCSWRFTSLNAENAAVVDFVGSLEGIRYYDSDRFLAVYPYSEANTSDGRRLVVTLPDVQEAVPGTFADRLFITVAQSDDRTLYFYNVCGGIRFSVTEADVRKVTFKGNAGETLAGTATVSFDDDGKPVVDDVADARAELTLSAPEGEALQPGKWYYLVSLPVTLSEGYTMTLHKVDGTAAVKSGSRPVTVKRAVWGQLEGVDADLEYGVPDNEIWYRSADGEPVNPTWRTDVYGVPALVSNTYKDGKGVLVFNGPLRDLYPFAFSNREQLVSISLPASVKTLGTLDFVGCSRLKEVSVPGWQAQFGANPFLGCEELENVICPNLAKDGVSLVVDGVLVSVIHAGLSSYTVPEGVQSLGALVFSDWTDKTIIIPAGLGTLETNAFIYANGYYPQNNRIVLMGDRLYWEVFRLWMDICWDGNLIEVESLYDRDQALEELTFIMERIRYICMELDRGMESEERAFELAKQLCEFMYAALGEHFSFSTEEVLYDPEDFCEWISGMVEEWWNEFDDSYRVFADS